MMAAEAAAIAAPREEEPQRGPVDETQLLAKLAESKSSPFTVPNQNQLYAYYLHVCGLHGVRRPHASILTLLEEDAHSRRVRLLDEAERIGVQLADLEELERQEEVFRAGAAQDGEGDGVTPLSLRTTLRLVLPAEVPSELQKHVHLGARGLMALLELVSQLPLLVVLDLSTVTSVYDTDAFRRAPSGNEVMAKLCEILRAHPSIREVDLRGQPIGSLVAQQLLEVAEFNRRITRIDVSGDGVHPMLLDRLREVLEGNRSLGVAGGKSVREFEFNPSILSHVVVDRKTAREQQTLRIILREATAFQSTTTAAELEVIVRHASVVSTGHAASASRGLDGDGEHLFIIASGVVEADVNLQRTPLSRGTYFGDVSAVVPYSTGLLYESQRGRVFRVPLAVCRGVIAQWDAKVAEFYRTISTTPLFQTASNAWALTRACQSATRVEYQPGATVYDVDDAFCGLYIVVSGAFEVLPRKAADRPVYFTDGDVFGEEALVARFSVYSGSVQAVGREHPSDLGGGAPAVAIAIRGESVKLLCHNLRPVLSAMARRYSLHPDLW